MKAHGQRSSRPQRDKSRTPEAKRASIERRATRREVAMIRRLERGA
jgi:hypothetical protein